MSEEIQLNIKKCFEESISVKQDVIQKGAYKPLLKAGDAIAESIRNGNKLMW